jgi:hypothetical protein
MKGILLLIICFLAILVMRFQYGWSAPVRYAVLMVVCIGGAILAAYVRVRIGGEG